MSSFVIYVGNIPYDASESDITSHLELDPSQCTVKINIAKDGRPNGDCFIDIKNQEAAELALKKGGTRMENTSNPTRNPRRLAISKSTQVEMSSNKAPLRGRDKWDGIVKLRGFTNESTEQHVREFLTGLQYNANTIVFPRNPLGQSIGEAFVQFYTYAQAQECIARDKQTMASISRYIDCMKSSNMEMRRALVAAIRAKHCPSIPQMMGPGLSNNPGPTYGGLVMNQNYMPQNMPGQMPGMNQGGYGQQNPNFGNFPGGPMKQAGGPMTSNNFGNMAQNAAHPYAMQHNQNNQNTNGNTNGGIPAKVEANDSACPFRNLVIVSGIPSGLTNSDVQEFFKPSKAIAVKLETNGTAMVAFKTHSDALTAMTKNGGSLRNNNVRLTLKSEPELQAGTWGSL